MLRAALALALLLPQDLAPVEDLGLRVAKGFKVTLVADHTLANDLYAMTLDSKGRIVVTSQGWIKTLHDDTGDGKPDRAETFAESRSGGMGLCFDGNDLLFSGGGGLWRYRDADADGKADGPPELISKFVFGEHGHHAIRKGPDGAWYLIGGNDTAIGKEHVTLPGSPVREPETGALVRYTPDLSKSEVIAHGFRNPYDFDFNEHGDLFTYDSDCERDYLLPWYTPTRLYHVAIGMHHGWRLRGYQRSFARRGYFVDSVEPLVPIGRGSPTGVVCYRHDAFPERYRGGVFYADWTFGKVYFTPLLPEGATYRSQVEVFIEPTGTEGFAPSDLCVAPDGSLLVSIGGRRTRGALYRIEWAGAPVPRRGPPQDDLEAVLNAPQPLDAWSRATWEPLARKLPAKALIDFLRAARGTVPQRIRAVEVLAELFDRKSFEGLTGDPSDAVRARLAWAVGRKGAVAPGIPSGQDSPRVLRAAFEALAGTSDADARSFEPGLGHSDKRVRQAAALGAARLPDDSWTALRAAGAQARLSRALAALWRGEKPVDVLVQILEAEASPPLRLEAVRLLVLALGDADLQKPPVEVQSNYGLPEPPAADVRRKILDALRPVFPSGHEFLDFEASRLLAMLEDEEPATVAKASGFVTDRSTATADVHYLAVLSRLKGSWPDGLAEKIAHAMLSLGRKLEGQEQRGKQVWGQRLGELAALFARRDPRFAAEILRNAAFVAPGHVEIANALPSEAKEEAAKKFLEASGKPGFGWSQQLVELLSTLPAALFHAALRGQWSNFGLRDTIVLRLSASPDPEDREKYLAGLEAANPQVADASLGALEKLPRDETPANLVPLLKLLRRLLLEPSQSSRRERVTALVARQSGRAFEIREAATTPVALKAAYAPVLDAFPALKGALESGEDPGALRALLASVPWEKGDAPRGAEVFRARGCQTCHAVQGALGPTLSGAAKRFSREDLFEAIANPSKDVAPLYRTTMFQTRDGQVYTGIIAFESADGYIVQTGATTTVRINTADVAGVRPGTLSLMPNDLLKSLKPEDLADLYAYLRSIP